MTRSNCAPDGTRGEMAHDAFLQEWIAGRQPDRVPPEIAAIIDRNARAAVILDDSTTAC
jgi:hypothetical protein